MACQATSLDMVQGTTVEVTISVTDSNDDPLTISSVEGKIRASLKTGSTTILLLDTYLTRPSPGIILLTIPAAITKSTVQTYGQGRYPYDIHAVLASGQEIQAARGTFNLKYSATDLA
jgi:hypothetical protein